MQRQMQLDRVGKYIATMSAKISMRGNINSEMVIFEEATVLYGLFMFI
jgi:hypothetical protein